VRLPVIRLPVVVAAIVTLVSGLALGASLGYLGGGEGPPAGRAAVVDQLALTQPNPEFVSQAMTLLRQAGYEVDYFDGPEITVGFYRTLPERDYDILVLRVHTGVTVEVGPGGDETLSEYVSLFTSEPFSDDRYLRERAVGLIGDAQPYGPQQTGERFFAITPGFIESAMKGRFDGTLVLMMGCDGLRSDRTARAFLGRGAGSVVSWSQPVSAPHTDAATERLLQKVLRDHLALDAAVAQTASEIGPDPWYGAELRMLAREG
jgi:hypothetical protein